MEIDIGFGEGNVRRFSYFYLFRKESSRFETFKIFYFLEKEISALPSVVSTGVYHPPHVYRQKEFFL